MSAIKIVPSFSNGRNGSRIIFGLSLLVFLFYLFAAVIFPDVYKYAFVGALFGLLWLPMSLGLFAIPVPGFIRMVKQKGADRRLALASLVMVAFTVLALALRSR